MTENQTLIAGILIAGAIFLHAYWATTTPKYELSAAGNEQTVWRINTTKGNVSMCGNVLPGNAFNKMEADQTKALMNLSKDTPPEESKKIFDNQERLMSLSHPTCTNWSTF